MEQRSTLAFCHLPRSDKKSLEVPSPWSRPGVRKGENVGIDTGRKCCIGGSSARGIYMEGVWEDLLGLELITKIVAEGEERKVLPGHSPLGPGWREGGQPWARGTPCLGSGRPLQKGCWTLGHKQDLRLVGSDGDFGVSPERGQGEPCSWL